MRSRLRPGGGIGSVGRGVVWWVRVQAVLRQLSEQNRCRRTRVNGVQQTGQSSRSGDVVGVDVVVLSSCGGVSAMAGPWSGGVAELFGAGVVGAQAVAVAVEVQDHAAVQEPVEHRGGEHVVA